MYDAQRRQMVREQLQARGITDLRVLQAFLAVPRHFFVPKHTEHEAYADRPVPIGSGQTVSQPYIVALTAQLLRLQGHERVLELGTGSGYQLAILALLAIEVFSVERLPELAEQAKARIERLGYLNVHMSHGNGSVGWAAHAPFDAIVVGAASPNIPQPLIDQLAEGGRMVIPVGSRQSQILTLVEKRGTTLQMRQVTSCVFVPFIGEYGWPAEDSP
ncbi:MAG: protein-L-isoaspartate(D-aspartate) O-methyltransferase [Candidatus Omnitrophica bacterium]|nr:protein-L-isoaspartate(D-aspartate) O-methyltransferase [Candidatus Omnitrophota bacterium]